MVETERLRKRVGEKKKTMIVWEGERADGLSGVLAETRCGRMDELVERVGSRTSRE